jgi:hypothetical protein
MKGMKEIEEKKEEIRGMSYSQESVTAAKQRPGQPRG